MILVRVGELASALTPQLRLYDDAGALLYSAQNSSVVDAVSITLPDAGEYTLMVLDNAGTAVGGYDLHLQRLNGPVGATALSFGVPVGDELLWVAQAKAFTFPAAAGDSIHAVLTEVTSALEPRLCLFAPDGTRLACNWAYDEVVLTHSPLPQNGTYALLVTDQPGTDVGSFTLALTKAGGGVAVPDRPVTEFRLRPAFPNPARTGASIAFDLPAPSPVRLAIHDVLGRTIRVLAEATFPAGRHAVQWDGRDATGRPVAAGVYLCRIQAGSRTATNGIAVVR